MVKERTKFHRKGLKKHKGRSAGRIPSLPYVFEGPLLLTRWTTVAVLILHLLCTTCNTVLLDLVSTVTENAKQFVPVATEFEAILGV